MNTITLLIVLALIGAGLYVAGSKLDATLRKIIIIIACVCGAVWLLGVLGVLPAQISLR